MPRSKAYFTQTHLRFEQVSIVDAALGANTVIEKVRGHHRRNANSND
jgi:hypothetical protein